MLSSRASLATFNEFSLSKAAYWLLLFLPIAILVGRAALDIAFTLLGFTYLVHALKNNDWSLFKPRWVKLALLIWFYLLVRSIFAIDIANNIDRGVFFGRYIFGALAIEWVFKQHQEAAKALFQILFAVVIFLIFDVYLQYFVGFDVFGNGIINGRLTGPFPDVRVGRMLVMLAFPVVCWMVQHPFIEDKPICNRLIGLSFSILFVGAVFVTGERMMFLLSIFGLLLAFLLLPHHKKYTLILIAVLPLTLALLSFNNAKIVDRQVNSTKIMIEHLQDTPYGQIWRNAVKVGMQNPLFGVGPKNFREVCPSLPPLEIHGYHIREQCNLHTHNFYLEWFAETGLLGLSMFVVLVGLWLSLFFKAIKAQRNNAVLIGFCVFTIIYLFPVKSSGSFFTNSVALPFWILMGWGLALTQKNYMAKAV